MEVIFLLLLLLLISAIQDLHNLEKRSVQMTQAIIWHTVKGLVLAFFFEG